MHSVKQSFEKHKFYLLFLTFTRFYLKKRSKNQDCPLKNHQHPSGITTFCNDLKVLYLYILQRFCDLQRYWNNWNLNIKNVSGLANYKHLPNNNNSNNPKCHLN